MRRRLPPLNSLAAFEAAARLGGFTRAARELAVAQPAVTRHVANLEAWVGAKLFVRRGNRVELSRDGEALADAAAASFDRLEVTLNKLARSSRNEVLIGASFGMTHMWLMPRISGLRGAAQGVAINFVTSENYRDFDASEVDLSIRFGNGAWPQHQFDLLFDEDCRAIVSPNFLANHTELRPDALAETISADMLIHHRDSFGAGWVTWPLWFEHLDLPPPDLDGRPTINNFPTVLEMVKAGDGVALGTAGLDDQAVASGEVQRVGPSIRRKGYGYFLVYQAGALERRPVRAIRRHLLTSSATT